MAAVEKKPTPPTPDGSGDDPSFTDYLLRETQYLYPLILLVAFISCAAWYSVVNAKKEEERVQPQVKGPGGKPLPLTRKRRGEDGERKIGPRFGHTAKLVFRYIAALIFLSYVASAVFMFVHAFWYEDPYKWSKEGLPWGGEWSVVSSRPVHSPNGLLFKIR